MLNELLSGIRQFSAVELAERTGISLWTARRLLAGKTRRPQGKTLQKLRGGGIIPQEVSALLVPPTVRTFAIVANLRFIEVESLLRTRLKPIEEMSPAELLHVVEAAAILPELYGWPARVKEE